jgi:hypothetical protein
MNELHKPPKDDGTEDCDLSMLMVTNIIHGFLREAQAIAIPVAPNELTTRC